MFPFPIWPRLRAARCTSPKSSCRRVQISALHGKMQKKNVGNTHANDVVKLLEHIDGNMVYNTLCHICFLFCWPSIPYWEHAHFCNIPVMD